MMGLFLEQFVGQTHEVRVCRDASEALTVLEAGQPVDLVVADLAMPGLNGFQFLERVRQQPTFDQVPVLMLSGSEKSEDRVRCLSAGADDFVPKPFSPDELLVRISNLLRRARLAA